MKTLMVISSQCKEPHGERVTQCEISEAIKNNKVESVELIINGVSVYVEHMPFDKSMKHLKLELFSN